MTYCVGILLNAGLVMASDSRTNAGVDQIASFSKMTVWDIPGERVLVLLSAGNLSLAQSVVHQLNDGLPPEADPAPDADRSGDPGDPGGTRDRPARARMTDVATMVDAVRLVGRAIRRVHRIDGPSLEARDPHAFNISFLLGGQITGWPCRLFQIYAAGNFIEAGVRTPFFQIGETKYGKPILDRGLGFDTELPEALKLALISMDSTLRSNLTVGLPIDVAVYPADHFALAVRRTITEADPYFSELRRRWSDALRDAIAALPDAALEG